MAGIERDQLYIQNGLNIMLNCSLRSIFADSTRKGSLTRVSLNQGVVEGINARLTPVNAAMERFVALQHSI